MLGLNPFWWSSCSLHHSLLSTNNHWVANIIAVSLEAPGFVILGLSGSCNLQLLGLGPWLIVKTAGKKLQRGSWVSLARMWTKAMPQLANGCWRLCSCIPSWCFAETALHCTQSSRMLTLTPVFRNYGDPEWLKNWKDHFNGSPWWSPSLGSLPLKPPDCHLCTEQTLLFISPKYHNDCSHRMKLRNLSRGYFQYWWEKQIYTS